MHLQSSIARVGVARLFEPNEICSLANLVAVNATGHEVAFDERDSKGAPLVQRGLVGGVLHQISPTKYFL